MTEQELRALVRGAIEKHLGHPPPAASPLVRGPDVRSTGLQPGPDVRGTVRSAGLQPGLNVHGNSHPSHLMFVVATGADDDGSCVIEPAVMCTHCGYCKSHGY